jgi:YD repeat-containing protein
MTFQPVDSTNKAVTVDGRRTDKPAAEDNMLKKNTWASACLAAALAALAGTGQAWAQTSLTRTSGFDYDSGSGLLTKEVVEPGNSDLCLVTTYTYDGYGNKTAAATRNCNGNTYGGGSYSEASAPSGNAVISSRSSSTGYSSSGSVSINSVSYSHAAGQFPVSATNALSQSETRTFDPRFGGVLSLTGPNSLTTTWTYDVMGRKATETRADGTVVSWSYTACGGSCFSDTKYVYYVTQTTVNSSTTVSPATKVYYDKLNREIRSEVVGFGGTAVYKDTEYNAVGQVYRVSLPYYSGGTPQWTTFAYDNLGRVTTRTEPNSAVTTTAYNGLTTTVTNALSQVEERIKNSQGQLIQVNRQ